MSRKEHIQALAHDLEDCARRALHFGYHEQAMALDVAASQIRRSLAPPPPERDSVMPPVLAGNIKARKTADEHFQNARRMLRGITRGGAK